MSGLKDVTSALSGQRETHESEPESHFRTRGLNGRPRCIFPRRYAVASMCYLAFFITGWMTTNLFVIFSHLLLNTDEEEHAAPFPLLKNMTFDDLDRMDLSSSLGSICVQIPGAILIIKFTGHSVLTMSVAAASIFHMLTPLTMHHNMLGTLAVVCLQGIAMGPMLAACFSLWREWAPPLERTRLVALSLGGMFISPFVSLYICVELIQHVGLVASYIIPGMCGLAWSLVWHTLTSDSPSNDPLISEAELLFLDEKIPPENKMKIEIKKIPIKSILTSPPVLTLCFVRFSEGAVLYAMLFGSFMFFMEQRDNAYNADYGGIFSLIWNAIIPIIGYLADLLIIKLNGRVTFVRKCCFCTAAAVHAVFLLAAFTRDTMSAVVCFSISYFAFTLSLSGYISNALDLSPHYAPVLVAMTTACFTLGSLTFEYSVEYFTSINETLETWKYPFLVTALLSASSAVLFSIFGSGEEQPWSNRNISTFGNRNDSSYYPQEHVDENSLVTDIL